MSCNKNRIINIKLIYKIWIAILISILPSRAFAQLSEGGIPPSFRYSAEEKTRSGIAIKNIYIPFSIEDLKADDQRLEEENNPPRVAILLPAGFTPKNSGTWRTLPNGEKIWQLRILADKATAIALYYKKFNLPPGGRLYIYNSTHTHIIGAYTPKTHSGTGKFATEFVAGDDIILEYVAPEGEETPRNPDIEIEEIGYGYNHLSIKDTGDEEISGSCMVDINCEEGSDWQDHKNGVVKMVIPIGTSSFLCTGTILNNTKEDLKPYLLTAFHCLLSSKGQATNDDLSQALFFFRYENSICKKNEQTTPVSMLGCTYIAGSPLQNGVDGALLLLKGKIPDNLNAFFNGWDRRGAAPQSGVCIHHPKGDGKKISTYGQPAVSDTWKSDLAQGIQNGHWNVTFKSTANGHGVTEGGSSGAPLFDENKRVVGFLTGGNANCTDRKEGRNLFGKLSLFWNQPGTSADQNIGKYLDPINSGAEYLNGRYAFPPKPVPEEVSAQWLPDSKNAIITWKSPKGEEQPVNYRIYRNKTEIGTTTALSFSESNLYTGIHYYEVTAIYADGKTSEPGNTASIHIYNILPAVKPTVKRIEEKDIQISWQMPVSHQKIFWGNATAHYAIQMRDKDDKPVPFYFGQRWTADELQEIDGYSLETVTFHAVSGSEYTLYITQGNHIYKQKIETPGQGGSTEVKLLKPFSIEGELPLTAAIYAESYTDSPAFTDNAEPIEQKGNLISLDGKNWKPLLQYTNTQNHNFLIQVGISSQKSNYTKLPDNNISSEKKSGDITIESFQIQCEPISSTRIAHKKIQPEICSSIPIRFNKPDFRVFRDGVNITPELVSDTFSTDRNLAQGKNYNYTIEAVYPQGESVPTSAEPFFLKNESFEARIRSLKINDENIDDISQKKVFDLPLECDLTTARIEIEAHPEATIQMGNQLSASAELNIKAGGKFNQPVTIISESGENVQEYTVNLYKLPENILLLRWNDVLSVINNPSNNNGLFFTEFTWYRNDELVDTGTPYIALPPDHSNADYYRVRVTTQEGVSLSGCETRVITTKDNIRLYPNPVKAGEEIKLYVDTSEEINEKIKITISDLSGKTRTMELSGNPVQFILSDTPGSYIVKIRTAGGLDREIKAICIP